MNTAGARALLAATLLLLYALLAHFSNANPSLRALGASLAVAPLVLAAWFAAGRAPHPLLTTALLAALVSALLLQFWQQIERNYPLMYLLQQQGAYLLLAVAFGRSLMPGQTALCSRWADLLHGPLPPAVQRYSRNVTIAWTMFFLGSGTLNLLLFTIAPLPVWSLFANFASPALALLLFLGEYSLRFLVLPPRHRVSIAAMVRAYLHSGQRGTAPRG
ncbi:MAG TPA: hypothetical protein VN859_08160 [Steroidobacteraceae bacterium]|nr:hypothetical protein [Steroidobacteraceae bacterium]